MRFAPRPSTEFRGGEWSPKGGRAASARVPPPGRWRIGVHGALALRSRLGELAHGSHLPGEPRSLSLPPAALALEEGGSSLPQLSKLPRREGDCVPCPTPWRGGGLTPTLST